MSAPVVITGARLSRSLAGPPGEERYLLDVSLESQGEKPVKGISLQVLYREEVLGAASYEFERLEPGDPGCRIAGVVLAGLDGPGRGGWADFPAWLREGRDVEIRVQVLQTMWIFTRWLKIPRLSDRKTCRVKAPPPEEGGARAE